jgi:hypothetical protein
VRDHGKWPVELLLVNAGHPRLPESFILLPLWDILERKTS